MRRFARLMSALVALAALPALGGEGFTVKGTFTFQGKTVTPTYVYAVAKPDSFDKTKEGVELVFTSEPIADKDLADMMPGTGTRLSASVGAEGSLYGIVFLYDGGSASTSGTSIKFEKKALDASRIAGRIYSTEEVGPDSMRGRFDLTFDAPLFREKKAAPPTAAEKAAAAKSPQAKAYGAYLKALHAGDQPGLKKVVAAELAKMMEGADFKEKLGFLQAIAPKTVEYLRVSESGDTANLELSSKDQKGTVELVREGGAWKVGAQRWKGGD